MHPRILSAVALLAAHVTANAALVTVEFSVDVASVAYAVNAERVVEAITPIVGLGTVTFDVDEVVHFFRGQEGGGTFSIFSQSAGVVWGSPVTAHLDTNPDSIAWTHFGSSVEVRRGDGTPPWTTSEHFGAGSTSSLWSDWGFSQSYTIALGYGGERSLGSPDSLTGSDLLALLRELQRAQTPLYFSESFNWNDISIPRYGSATWFDDHALITRVITADEAMPMPTPGSISLILLGVLLMSDFFSRRRSALNSSAP